MSAQFHDFGAAADQSARIEAPFGLENLGLLGKLSGLIDELNGVVSETRRENAAESVNHQEQIRNLRVEFGFEPDDEPKAHLRPFIV